MRCNMWYKRNKIMSILFSLAVIQNIFNLGHNILEFYKVLTQTETKRDILCSKLGIRVASRVAQRLKT